MIWETAIASAAFAFAAYQFANRPKFADRQDRLDAAFKKLCGETESRFDALEAELREKKVNQALAETLGAGKPRRPFPR